MSRRTSAESVSPGRRLAAVLSLVCLLGALVSVVFSIVQGGAWRLAAALAAAAVAVVGLWYALTRRGAARLAGAGAATVAVAALLAVALTAQYRGVAVGAAVALVAASGWAARHALGGGEEEEAGAPSPSGPEAPPARHPVLLVNLRSGGGKAAKFHLEDECRSRGIQAIVLGPGDDLAGLARHAVAGGADLIGMAGGDGSQALVATVASETGTPYVCVPAGTRNHFALDLGVDRDDVVGALDAFAPGAPERRVDLARVNGRVFVNNACMGLYAEIVRSSSYRDAKLKTAAGMLPDMIGPAAEPFDLRFEGPDGAAHPSTHLLLVSNNPYELEHLSGGGSRTRMDLGTLGVVSARIAGPAEALEFVALEAAGRIRSFAGWSEWETPRFVVDSASPVDIGIDGESLCMDPPLVFESVPGALRVRLPPHAAGLAPAARAVHLGGGSTVTSLIRTAAGRPPPQA